MLKGLLPSLKAEKIQNQKKPQSQKPESPNPGQNEAFQTASLNLLTNIQQKAVPFKRDENTASIFRKIILISSVLFTALLISNYLLFLHLNKLGAEQTRLTKILISRADSEKKVIEVDRNVTYFKEILRLRKLLSPRAAFVFDNVSEGIDLGEVRITYPSFEITAHAKTPYDFTKLIFNYLSGDYVSEVVLKSANLNPLTKSFDLTMGGVFK